MRYENDREDYEFMTSLRALEAQRWKEMEERVYYERLEAKAKEDLKKVQEYKFKKSTDALLFELRNAPVIVLENEKRIQKEKSRTNLLEKRTMMNKIKSDGYIISTVNNDNHATFMAVKNDISVVAYGTRRLFEKIYGTKN